MIFFLAVPWFSMLLVAFQHAVLGALFFHSFAVEVSLVLVVFAGLRMRALQGAMLALILGLMMDCISGSGSGSYALVYAIVLLMAYLVSTHVYVENAPFLIFLTLVCGLVEGLSLLALNRMLYGTNVFYDLARFFLPQLALVSALSPFLFKVFHRMGWLHDGYVRSFERP
ncbi:MAG: rod shape-determining protein MreD [Pseudomonadota bacterium]|nr:rod shape-determining protein MreD [Pseudomonadota bacterium]